MIQIHPYEESFDSDGSESKLIVESINETDKTKYETITELPLTNSIERNELIAQKKRKFYKNLIILSVSFFLAFSASNSLSNLQSTLNKENHIGTKSLFIGSIAFLFSCLLLPALTIKTFGYKWGLFLCQVLLSFFIVANFYPRWWTLYPTQALSGIASGPLWTIQGCFISDLAKEYAALSHERPDAVISRFFGIFMIIFQCQQVVGNFISSVILKRNSNSDLPFFNVTQNGTDFHSYCGAYECIDHINGNTQGDETVIPPDTTTVYILCGVYLFIALFGIALVAVFMDDIKHKSEVKSTIESLLDAVYLFNDWRAWLLIPIQGMCCFVSVYIATDITKYFVGCLKGVEYIGYWFVCFGIIASINAFIVGHSVKYVGRIPFFILGFSFVIGLHSFMLFWHPKTSEAYLIFLFALFYGFAEGVWSTQINSLIATLFHSNEPAAFSNNRLCSSIMFVTGFAYSTYFCIRHRVYIILGAAGISVVSYAILESKIRATREYTKTHIKE